MNALNLIAAKVDIRRANPRTYVQQRIGENAQALSRAGEAAARVERLNEALCRLVEILYQADPDGSLPNIDAVTYRLLIPAPFGSKGWRRWGLRHHEGRALSLILRGRCSARQAGQRGHLFDYNEIEQTWHLNLADYPAKESALLYLSRRPVTRGEYQAVVHPVTKGVTSRVTRPVTAKVTRGNNTVEGG